MYTGAWKSKEGHMVPGRMPSNDYHSSRRVPYDGGAQRATNDEIFRNRHLGGFEQQISANDPARNASYFHGDDGSPGMGMPGNDLGFGDAASSLAGMRGGSPTPFGDLTSQVPRTFNPSDHDVNQANVIQLHDGQLAFLSTANYTDNSGGNVDNTLPTNLHMRISPNRSQMQATPYNNQYFWHDQMNDNMRENPWSPYAAAVPPADSRTPSMPTFAKGLSSLSPPQQGQRGSLRQRRKSGASSKSVPPNAHSSFRDHGRYPPAFKSPSRSSSQRLSVAEGSHSASKPLSPTPSNGDEILNCGRDNCDATFTGIYRKGNRSRHWRELHGGKEYPCEEPGCTKNYKRQDARLKHCRKHHPGLGLGPPLSRKEYYSM